MKELEIGGTTISFLDLSIDISSGNRQFGILHKPTSADTTIHGSSYISPLPSPRLNTLGLRVIDYSLFPLRRRPFKKNGASLKLGWLITIQS